eukprot:g30110.t1
MNRNANYNIRERMANRFEVDQRAALFGSRFPGKGAQKPKDDMYAATSREMMERQNDAAIEESHSCLDRIDFDKAASLLKGTLGHLKGMMANKSSKHMIYMVLFVLCLFMLMYFLRKLSFGSGGATSIQLKENASQGN